MSARDKRLEKAQMRVLFQVPFFAPGVAKLPVVFDDTVQTACTDGKRIRWNGKWFDSLPDACLPTVLCHEVCHCLLGHLWRAPQGVEWNTWNQACVASDVPIRLWNGTLHRAGDIQLGCELYTPFGKAVVSGIIHKRSREMVRLRLANSRSLICTADHPIVTTDGICREAQFCKGDSVFQAVEREGEKVSTQELVKAYCNADRRHIGAHIQDVLRASEKDWLAQESRWPKGKGCTGSDEAATAVATWLYRWLNRWRRDGLYARSENKAEGVLPTSGGDNHDVRATGPSSGGIGVLPNKESQFSRGGVFKGVADQLGILRCFVEAIVTFPDDQEAPSATIFEPFPVAISSRLLGKPAWLERISGQVESPSSFERQAVVGIEKLSGTEDVCDFVTDIGCYVADGVLVHNCDHSVNLMLKEFSELVMSKRLADPFPFPDPQDAYCANPAFKGLAEEVIYQRLSQNKPKQPNGSENASGQSGGVSTPGKGGKASPAPSGAHSMPEFGQMEEPQNTPQGTGEGRKLANDWEGTLVQAAQMAQGRGDCPSSLKRLVDEIVDPTVPWQQVLRSLIVEQANDDWDFMKPAVEYCDQSDGLILPSLNSEKMGTVVFATDSSGSTCSLIAAMQSEKQEVLDDLRPSKMVDIYCDAAVHDVFEYTPGDRITKEVGGSGGTDFRPVWDYVSKMTETPKVIVYLTDMDGTFGEDPRVPVIWVTWTRDSKPPFGTVVYAPEK